MKKINDPLSKGRQRNKKKNWKVKEVLLFTMVPFLTFGGNFTSTMDSLEVYNKMNVEFTSENTIEYNSEFNGMDFVKKVPIGKVVTISHIDTKKLGKHEVLYIVSKDNIIKEIYTDIEVVDTKAPEINLEKENITIYLGNDYDIKSNIKSVTDEVDGDIPYKTDDINEDECYYTIETNFDKNNVGDYPVKVKAIDKQGNTSEKSYTISVQRRYTYAYTNRNVNATVDTSSVVAAAYSLLGYNYVGGGTSPQTGFDCTGFVYYIYSLFGKQVGRSTSNIVYSGTGVSPDNMEPGDIIVWSTRYDNYPTHAALYVGGGNMIHAANYNDGVILSSVSQWASWGAHIVAVRRV